MLWRRGVLASLLFFLLCSFEVFGATYNFSAVQVLEGLKRAFLNGKPLLLRAGVQGLAIYLATDIIANNSEYGDLATSISYCIGSSTPGCSSTTVDIYKYVSDCSTQITGLVQDASGSLLVEVPCSQKLIPANSTICAFYTASPYRPLSVHSVTCSAGYYYRFFDVYSYINPSCQTVNVYSSIVRCSGTTEVAFFYGCNNITFSGSIPSCSKLGIVPGDVPVSDPQRLQDLLTNIANYSVPASLQDDLDLAFQDTSGAIVETGEAVIVPPTDQTGPDIIVLPFPDAGSGAGSGSGSGSGADTGSGSGSGTGAGSGAGTGSGTGTGVQDVRIVVDPSDIDAITGVSDNTYDTQIDVPDARSIPQLIEDFIANSPLMRWVTDVQLDVTPGACSVDGSFDIHGVVKNFTLDFCPLEPYLNQIGAFILAFAHLYALYIVFKIN